MLEEILSIIVDVIRFTNPAQVNFLEGNSLNGFLFVGLIFSAIAFLPKLTDIIVAHTGMPDVQGGFVAFVILFIVIMSVPQSGIIQSIAFPLILMFRFIDGYGFGNFLNRQYSETYLPHSIGLFFSIIYGICLFSSILEPEWQQVHTILFYLISFVVESLSLIGLCKLIFSIDIALGVASMYSISACFLVVSSFIGSFEHAHTQDGFIESFTSISSLSQLCVYLAFPIGAIVAKSRLSDFKN